MNDETKSRLADILRDMASIKWFSSIGESVDDNMYESVPSLEHALKYISQNKWINFQIPIINAEQDRLHGSLPDERIEPVNIQIEGAANRFFDENASKIFARADFPESAQTLVRADFQMMILEYVWEERCSPMFYLKVLYPIYRSGHLPCGWTGNALPNDWNGETLKDLPSGKIRVY